MIKRFSFTGDVPESRAFRSVRCDVLRDLTPDAPFDTVRIDWCDEPADGDLIAEEVVLRGADWLDQRWRDGGERFKHIALTRRAGGLTQAEFSERWRDHGGTVGTTPIPDLVKGCAYAQNHPVPGDWPYDAVNEVWFDDLDGLRRRVVWFTEHAPGGDDLFGPPTFLAVREVLIT